MSTKPPEGFKKEAVRLALTSDRGSQSASDEFLTALKPYDILSSMSRDLCLSLIVCTSLSIRAI